MIFFLIARRCIYSWQRVRKSTLVSVHAAVLSSPSPSGPRHTAARGVPTAGLGVRRTFLFGVLFLVHGA